MSTEFFGQSQQHINPYDFIQDQYFINRTGMLILSCWALGNIVLSSISLSKASRQNKAFHQMNLGWNAINAIIAGIGYYGSIKDPATLSILSALKEHENMKQLLLLNTGLDIAYIAGGFYLNEKAKNKSHRFDQLKGFGNSVIMNGMFLLCFDLIMYFIHKHHGDHSIYQSLTSITLSTKIGFVFNF